MPEELLKQLKSKAAREVYSKKPIPEGLLQELLDVANHAPSRFNLQPWHFIVINNDSLKKLIYHISLEQDPVVEAPVTIALVADPKAWKRPFSEVLRLSVDSGALTEQRAKLYRKRVNTFFETGLFGFKGLLKKMILPFKEITQPVAKYICSKTEAESYVNSQAMLAAGTFLVAAKASGLSSSTIMSFDEERLKQLLAVPKSMSIPMLISVGYPLEMDSSSVKEVRFPIEDKTSVNLFGNTVRLIKLKASEEKS